MINNNIDKKVYKACGKPQSSRDLYDQINSSKKIVIKKNSNFVNFLMNCFSQNKDNVISDKHGWLKIK